MKLSNQQQQVLDYVHRWGGINSIEAIRHFGITRLAARVCELKDTPYALKAVPDVNASKGFVRYIVDEEARENCLADMFMREFNQLVGRSRPPTDFANLMHKYAAKFALLAVKQSERVSEAA